VKLGDDIAAGDLNCSIALYSPQHNASGDEITGWTLIQAGIAASKRTLQGRETLDAARDTSEQLVLWTVRYRAGLDTAKRLTHAGSHYDIVALVDPTGNRRRLDITTKLVL
jgi:SPP1 family predicted phage head-tail adaptor